MSNVVFLCKNIGFSPFLDFESYYFQGQRSTVQHIGSNCKQYLLHLLFCSVSVKLVGAVYIILKSSQRSSSAARTIKCM